MKQVKKNVEKLNQLAKKVEQQKFNFLKIRSHHSIKRHEIKFELDYIKQVFFQLKDLMTLQQAKETNKLKMMTIKSNEMLEYLSWLKSRGESILKLVQICQKLETQSEKIFTKEIARPCDEVKETNELHRCEITLPFNHLK